MRWFAILLVAGTIAGGVLVVRPGLVGLQTESVFPASERESNAANARVAIFAGGTVEGTHRELSLKFEIAGRLKEVLVKAGDHVAKGDILAQLDPELLELKFTEARNLLKLAHAEHDRLSKGSSPARQDDLTIAEAKVTLAEGALRRERIMLEKSLLAAPISGLVLRVAVEAGELVGPNDEREVLSLVNRDVARVRAYVEELDAMNVTVGQKAVVTADGRPDRPYAGIVQSCSPYVAPKSHRHLKPGELFDIRMREVLIDLVEGADLLIGLPVDVMIEPGPAERVESPPVYEKPTRDKVPATANASTGSPIKAAGFQMDAVRRPKKP